MGKRLQVNIKHESSKVAGILLLQLGHYSTYTSGQQTNIEDHLAIIKHNFIREWITN